VDNGEEQHNLMLHGDVKSLDLVPYSILLGFWLLTGRPNVLSGRFNFVRKVELKLDKKLRDLSLIRSIK